LTILFAIVPLFDMIFVSFQADRLVSSRDIFDVDALVRGATHACLPVAHFRRISSAKVMRSVSTFLRAVFFALHFVNDTDTTPLLRRYAAAIISACRPLFFCCFAVRILR